ncbi:MAG TPA: DNA mismatch repair protein MutS [Myxococcota bacterium]|nr:DNA mismatch repair protein MutS [Myxococcota bacterium]
MMRQYLETKAEYPDCIIFFRLGDFYEMFFEDAETASAILDIALTSRAKGKGSYPMCGVPHFSANGYIKKLVEAGHKVAVCDQVEDARQAKGIVKRAVTRVVSPGMITDLEDLEAGTANFLGALDNAQDGAGPYGFAFMDVSTAEFRVTQLADRESLLAELARVMPRELLLPADAGADNLRGVIAERLPGVFIRTADGAASDAEIPAEIEEELFSHITTGGLQAARSLFAYASSSLPGSLDHIRRLIPYRVCDFMVIDEHTRVNLEILATQMDGRRQGSLLALLDRTRTPMGARLLASWLLYPLLSPERIDERQNAVEQLLTDAVRRADILARLKEIRDLERLLGKVAVGRATPRDLGLLRDSFEALPSWSELVQGGEGALGGLIGRVDVLEDLFQALSAALSEDPPADVGEGGAIRPGYDTHLDELREMASSGRSYIAGLEQQERATTGISSLKIRYNRVFGYFIEVTKPNLHLVPEHYRRKQTTANAERFETPELKQKEEQILGAQDESLALEKEMIASLAGRVSRESQRILAVARQVATSDVIACLSELAAECGYCRPQVDESDKIEIRLGRHPVVEKYLSGERFVPNDTSVSCADEQILVITGPNMAGKSTVIRQVGLICIMAQMGSFVPAAAARIGVVDRVFTRIGAADSLARGLSTFMVEMTETAHILRHATRRSLLVLDEIGRGTSTFDGLSIAWAVAEYIHDRIGARTLFATHYHQLTELALTKPRVANYTISVKEWKEQIIFLRTLVKGICSRSYGIQVGKLAGLPAEVVSRSLQVLANLEMGEYDEIGTPNLSKAVRDGSRRSGQLRLFSQAGPAPRSPLEDELDKLDLDSLAPREALDILYGMKKDLRDKK